MQQVEHLVSRHGTVSKLSGTYSTECQWNEHFDTLKPQQNARHFADESFKCSFVIENDWTTINISLKFVIFGSGNDLAPNGRHAIPWTCDDPDIWRHMASLDHI